MFLLSFLFTFTFCYYLFIFYIKSNLSRRGTSSLFISIIILIMIVRKPAGNNGKTKTDINYQSFDSFGVFIEGIYKVYGITVIKKNKFYPKIWQTSDYRFN